MFVRTRFVTNSSSTSFIFYGTDYHQDDYETAIAYVDRLGQLDCSENAEDFEIQDALERYFTRNNPGVGIHIEYECEAFQIYIKQSYLELYEAGVDELPVTKLQNMIGKHESEWDKALRRAGKSLGVDRSTPGWRIALCIER
jgi:hypothetical protein